MSQSPSASRMNELKREAAGLRDRRDFAGLRRIAGEAERVQPGAPWVRQILAICEAQDAVDAKSTDPANALRLSGELKAAFEFALAARQLGLAWRAALAATPRDAALVRRLGHELALCTYKDEERVPAKRLQKALALLDAVRAEAGADGETLRLTGAVYKHRWEISGEADDLLSARASYLEALSRDPVEDAGYGAVNAAFLCDALAAQERERSLRLGAQAAQSAPGARYLDEARQLREGVKQRLLGKPATEYWTLVTLAEAHFGLGEFAAAADCLRKARAAADSDWKVQSTAQQLAALFAHQSAARGGADADVEADAMGALGELAQFTVTGAKALVRGKVGLALSGGGFRASLFHLGVLARLAEMDVLRHVETISTVSGGSIVGAHYYLRLKRLLEDVADGQLKAADYVTLVERLIPDFLAGVRRNLRMRTLSNLRRNLEMLGGSYTRSTRLGDLYSDYFYPRAGQAGDAADPLRMSELLINPCNTPPGESFNPKFGNWRRDHKVPVLLLNATPLNTGHGWHFTARSMGEPPSLAGEDIDCKPRYRRLYYSQAPTEALRNFRLGHAVAASAGVPGLFEPIVLEGLYPERTVRLVDGGVHDNQGVAGLLDEGCTFILCSDASGQMGEEKQPPGSTAGVLLRTNSVLMDRVREAEYLDLDARKQSRSLTGFMFLHLKKDIAAANLDWIGCQDRSSPADPTGRLPYGIDRDIQEKLAALRTDLDAFTDEEAAALMASGYLMAEQECARLDRAARGGGRWGGFDIGAPRRNWPFLEPGFVTLLGQAPGASPQREALGKRLAVGAELFFKVLRVDPWSWVFLLGALAAVLWLLRDLLPLIPDLELVGRVTVQDAAWALLAFVAVAVLPVLGWLRPDNMLRKLATRGAFAVVGFLVCTCYLLVFNRRYLKSGRLKDFYG